MNRLKEFYDAEIVDAMTKQFSYKNKMAVPKLEKIVINMGVGEAKENAKILDGAEVVYYTPYDNFGEIYWDNGEIAHYVKYLAICVYPNKNNEFYLFCCDEQYDVVGDSLWDSIEMCMAVANTSHGGQIIWIKNEV